MNRTTVKTLSLLALAAFPFIAGCAGPSERVHQNIQGGVSVKRADVSAALKDGENPWAMHGTDGQIFSLFEYAVKKGELDLLDLCLANKSTPELAEAQTSAYVESVVAKISDDYAAEREVKICEKIWNAGLALATKPKLEAKQRKVEEMLEAKRRQLEEERRKQACIMTIKSEKQQIFQRLQEEIFPEEQKLSEEERSRGRALLDAFGEEHMPLLAEQCKKARTRYLETEANLKELVAALKAEDPNFSPEDAVSRHPNRQGTDNSQKENPVYSAAKARCLELAADYWQLRYTLTDYYSQFKIGVIASDELAAKDEELVALFAEAEKINLTESESK